MKTTVGIYCEPLARGSVRNGFVRRLNKHYTAALGPRDESYMRRLFEQHHPDGAFFNAGIDDSWRGPIQSAGVIVLLFPDAIGFGFSRLEREVRRFKPRIAELRFLNGRNRSLAVSSNVQAQLVLRRLLVRFLVCELLAIVPFFVATLWFSVCDLVGGRR